MFFVLLHLSSSSYQELFKLKFFLYVFLFSLYLFFYHFFLLFFVFFCCSSNNFDFMFFFFLVHVFLLFLSCIVFFSYTAVDLLFLCIRWQGNLI